MGYYELLLARKLSGGGGGGGSITPEIKTALLAAFSKVAWVDENGQDYYNTLQNALYTPADLVSISATFTGVSVTDTTPLDEVKEDLVVTASWSDESTSTVGADYYELSGTLTVGTSTLTVSYLGKTTTVDVTVTQGATLLYSWDLKTSLTDTINGVTASTVANLVVGTGLVFSVIQTYCDFGQVYARNRTYELDVLELGTHASSVDCHRRMLMFDTDNITGTGGAGLIDCAGANSRRGWAFYLGSAWDSTYIVQGVGMDDKHTYFNGKTVKIYLDSSGYATVYRKDIGSSDSTYELVGSSTGALNNYTNGHVYIGSSGNADSIANATFTGLRIYDGEK